MQQALAGGGGAGPSASSNAGVSFVASLMRLFHTVISLVSRL